MNRKLYYEGKYCEYFCFKRIHSCTNDPNYQISELYDEINADRYKFAIKAINSNSQFRGNFTIDDMVLYSSAKYETNIRFNNKSGNAGFIFKVQACVDGNDNY